MHYQPTNRLADQAQLMATLAELTQAGSVDKRFASVYLPDAFTMHTTGLPKTDRMWHEQFVSGGLDTVRNYQELYQNGQKGEFIPHRDADPKYRLELLSESTQEWMFQIEGQVLMGLAIRPAIKALLGALHVNYGLEAGLLHKGFPLLAQSDISLLFNEEEQRARIEPAAFLARLRERKEVDLSERTLNTRFDHAFRSLQLELGVSYMVQLENYASLSPNKGKQAIDMFLQEQPVIVHGDMAARLAMHESFVAFCTKQAQRESNNRQMARMLQLLAQRASMFAATVQANLHSFRHIFTNLQCPFPAELAAVPIPKELQRPLGAVATAGSVGDAGQETAVDQAPAAVSPEEVARRAVVRKNIETRASELHKQAAVLSAEWRLNESARKRLQLRPVTQRLVRKGIIAPPAVPGGLPQQAVPPMVEDLAECIVDTIATLDSLARPSKKAPPRTTKSLEEAIALQETIEAGVRTLHKQASQYELPPEIVRSPQVVAVRATAERLRQNWPYYRSFILDVWPGGQAIQTVKNVERALFPLEATK